MPPSIYLPSTFNFTPFDVSAIAVKENERERLTYCATIPTDSMKVLNVHIKQKNFIWTCKRFRDRTESVFENYGGFSESFLFSSKVNALTAFVPKTNFFG